MKKKIEGKIKAAHIWKYITIVATVLLVVTILFSKVISANVKSSEDMGTVCIGFAVIAEFVCLMTYFGFRRNILTSTKLLLDKGVDLDEVAKDLDNAETVGIIGKVRCGKKYFSISSPFCVFAYNDIAWIYRQRTTTTNTSTGATTTNKTVIFCTVQGKKYTTYISWGAAKKFLEEHRDKFSTDLIVGYKMKYKKQYKEIVKNSK